MPSALALSVGFLLVALLLWKAVDRDRQVRASMWLAVVWVGILGSRSVSYWLPWGPPEAPYMEGSPVDRLVHVGLIAATLLALLIAKPSWGSFFYQNPWLVTLLVYCLLSVLWSEYPWTSFRRYIRFLGTILAVVLVIKEDDPDLGIRTLFRRLAFILIPLSIIAIEYYPSVGMRGDILTNSIMLTGLTLHKNNLGALCMVCGLFLLAELILWKRGRLSLTRAEVIGISTVLMVTIWLLLRTNSATALLCFCWGSLLLLALETPLLRSSVRFLGLVSIGSFVFAFSLETVFGLSEKVATMLGRDLTLTGRTELWSTVIEMVPSATFGAGFESFWLGPRLSELWFKYPWQPTQSHNGFLETYLNLGLIGLVLLSGFLISSFWKLKADILNDNPLGPLKLSLLIVTIFYNWTEAAFGVHLLTVVLLTVAIKYQPEQQFREATAGSVVTGLGRQAQRVPYPHRVSSQHRGLGVS